MFKKKHLGVIDTEISRIASKIEKTKESYPDEKYAGIISILHSDLETAGKIAYKLEEEYGVEDINIGIDKSSSLLLITTKKAIPYERKLNIAGCTILHMYTMIMVKIR